MFLFELQLSLNLKFFSNLTIIIFIFIYIMKTTFALIIGGALYVAGIYTGKLISNPQNKQELKNPPIQSIKQKYQSINLKQVVYPVSNTFAESTIRDIIRKIDYPHFKIIYSTYHKCPLAVHQLLTPQLLVKEGAQRIKYFRQSKIQSKFQSAPEDYSQGYKYFQLQVGHMAPAANYGKQSDKNDTFTMANMVPQHKSSNIGIWKTFELYQRNLLQRKQKKICDSVQIISGPIFYKNNPSRHKIENEQKQLPNIYKIQANVLTKNGIVVPQKLYKIIKCNKDEKSYLNAFEFQNRYVQNEKGQKNNKQRLKKYLSTVQQIQNQTGLQFNLGVSQSLLQYDDFQGAFNKN